MRNPQPIDQRRIDAALAGELVMSIGQIDPPTRRALDRLAKIGKLVRCRASFMRISPWKTAWLRPDMCSQDWPEFFIGKHLVRLPSVAAGA